MLPAGSAAVRATSREEPQGSCFIPAGQIGSVGNNPRALRSPHQKSIYRAQAQPTYIAAHTGKKCSFNTNQRGLYWRMMQRHGFFLPRYQVLLDASMSGRGSRR